MSNIRSKNTSPERLVFCLLRRRGVYFQKHYKGVFGKPDIALPRKKIAVFIDGDFWHGRNDGQDRFDQGTYWHEKIKGNKERDHRNRSKLRRQGWRVMRVWEKDLKKNPERVVNNIAKFLRRKKTKDLNPNHIETVLKL